jgi:hypothetical protein
MRVRTAAIVISALLWGAPAEAQEPHQPCGSFPSESSGEVRVLVRGASCAEALRVAERFWRTGRHTPPWWCGLSHNDAARTSAFSCGWGGTRGDIRKWPHSLITDLDPPWPYPLWRPTASPEAQAFMPLLYLDDDEHWPLSNPDWFLSYARVERCPRVPRRCEGLFKREGQLFGEYDTRLRFDPEQKREGAPGVMFVNQVEPGAPAVPYGPPISTAYRFFDYWWFYSYNRGPYGWSRPVAGNHDHLSDWEGATVATLPGRTDRFEFVALSAHEAAWNYLPGVLRCGEGLEGDDRHETGCEGRRRVNVYAAEGTHANFPRRCGRSLLELNPLERGICQQTGLTEVRDGVFVNLPEGRFNGRDDGPSRIPGSELKTLTPVGVWDWVQYSGWWDDSEDVKSPSMQARFRDPLHGRRDCTRRWDGPNERTDCTPEFRAPGGPPAGSAGGPRSARLGAIAAQAAGAVDPCEAWFGPMVRVSACQPELLQAALRDGRLNAGGGPAVSGAQVASGLGIAQAIGAPAVPGRPVAVRGSGEPADVRVRVEAPGGTLDARFSDVPLAPVRPFRVTVTRRGRVTGRTAAGVRLRPDGTRRTRHGGRRPPRGVRARRGRFGLVVVRFRRVPARLVVELRRRRGDPPIVSEIVRGRRGRVTLFPPLRAARPRLAAVRRLSSAGMPSRARVVRIRR